MVTTQEVNSSSGYCDHAPHAGGITIAASAVTVDDGSKPSPHQRLDSASLGSPEADEEREPMNLIMSQTSSMCNKSDTEFAT